MTRSDQFEVELIERLINLHQKLPVNQKKPESLDTSESKLDTILQSISDGIVVTDTADNIVYVNRAAARMFDFDRSRDMLKFSASRLMQRFEIVDEQGQPFPVKQLPHRITLQNGESSQTTLCFLPKSGTETFWATVTSTPVFDENRQTRFAVMALHDITLRKESEDALRKSEELVGSIFRSAPVGIGLVIDRVIKMVNSRLCEITGYSEAELIDQSARIMYPTDEEYEFVGREKYSQIGDRGTGTVETRWQCKDGRLIDVLLSSTPLDLNDLSKGVTFTALDITESRQTMESLRESRQLLNATEQLAKIGGWEWNPIRNTMMWTDETYHIHGMKPGEFPAGSPEHVERSIACYDPDDRPVIAEAFRRCIEEKQPYDLEFPLTTVDGRRIWIQTMGEPVLDGERVIKVIGHIADITERKQAEQALSRSEARYRTLFEQANDAFFVNTTDDRIVDMNQRACELLGYSREELLQMVVPDLQAPEIRGRSGTVIKEELAKSQDGPFEAIDLHRDGTRIPVEITTTPIFGGDGDNKLVLSVVRDVTERKQSEQSLRHYAARLEALRKIERSILSASVPAEIAEAALYHIQQMLPCLRASISVATAYDPDNFEVLAVTAQGYTKIGTGAYLPKSVLDIPLLQQGRIDIINDLQQVQDAHVRGHLLQQLYTEGVRSYINVPLVAEQQLIGTLNVGADHPHAYDSGHLEIAREIADSLAVAIHHAHLYEQARKDAETKTTLLREVNHRVKNNLAAIVGLLYVEKNHANMQDSELYRNIMTDLIKRIEGISTVHQMLSDSEWMPLSLEKLTIKLLNSTFQLLPSGQSISLRVNCPDEVYIVPKQANSLAILLNELTTNTVKYALPSRSHVTVQINIERLSSELVRLHYQDNGPGFPPEVLQKRDFSVGLYLLHNIVASDLRGDVTLENDDGAKITINFKPLT